ncbi:MAG TPA: serine/threonine-protein kinase [Mycobacterium sp.]|nr:serine/threonine-protein kinase [Mycobacterium sp.]
MPPTDHDIDGLGDYVIGRKVGRGGCATVYAAHRAADPQRTVALKVLDTDHRTPAEQARLAHEFDICRRLDHPHILRVYERGPCWLAMQFVDGCYADRLPALDDRLTALAQIADALDYTHHRGIVHCDVKPANILVTSDASPICAVLIDFGVAHAVVDDVGRHQENPLVSLPYTAPEILLGRPPTAATDQYALGCTAVELLTGTPPFTFDNPADVVEAHLRLIPPAVSHGVDWAPRSLDLVLARAIAKIPERRYRSCAEFVENLNRALHRP